MGQYRKIFTPFGQAEYSFPADVIEAGGYRMDWPGIVGTAESLGVAANQIINAAQSLSPGAGVMAPSDAPPLLQAPTAAPVGGGFPWVLAIGAVGLWYFTK